MPRTSSSYTVASIDRALEVLLLLERTPSALGVTELAKLLGVHKSTVHSILQTLLYRGFVQQTDTLRYTLGTRLLRLGEVCAERLDVRKIARPIMEDLAKETNEVALLAVLSRDELIIVDKAEPQRPFLIIPKFDFSIAIHSTAVGKVLLANASEEVFDIVLARGLEKYTPYTLDSRQALLAELAKVRADGYAIGCNETIEGITCMGVPVYNAQNEVAAALSISSASSILTADRYPELIATLKEKAAQISSRLGYHL